MIADPKWECDSFSKKIPLVLALGKLSWSLADGDVGGGFQRQRKC